MLTYSLFILLCFPSQVTFPFSRVISIHHYSSTLILSATLIPHSFSLPPTSENVVIRDNSLQLPTTLPTNLNQSSPPSSTCYKRGGFFILKSSPIACLHFGFNHPLLPSQEIYIYLFFMASFYVYFHFTSFTESFPLSYFTLYSFTFPTYK